MAKSMTVGKRENEKKRLAKREAKLKRKEGRKSTKSSFDDMIAYVDENGRITSTPPEVSANDRKPKSASEQTSVVTSDNVETGRSESNTNERKGRVEHVNAEKGYGFIKEAAKTDKFFFHVSGLLEAIQVGDNVVFELERGKKGYNAVRIRKQVAD